MQRITESWNSTPPLEKRMERTVAMMLSVRPGLPAGYLQMPMMPSMSPSRVQQPVKARITAQMPSALLMAGTGGISGRDGGTGGKGDLSDIGRIVAREKERRNV